MRSNSAFAGLSGLAFSIFVSVALADAGNPPPVAPLSGYQTYDLKPLLVSDELKASETELKATAKIQEHIDAQLTPVVSGWEKKMAEGQATGRTLVIEPSVEDLRFIGGGKRFFAGAFAGKSHVVMKLKITEQPGDKVIAEPEFYQHSSAMAGAWTMGANDNNMLQRVVELAAEYLSANYQTAIGGKSGREELEKDKDGK